MERQFSLAKGLLAESRRSVALTGAGISTPSGIPDFRSPESGLWENVDPYQVASVYGFRQRPEDFFDWIRPVAKIAFDAEPNAAHKALAKMEREGLLKGIITQNIDMLHSKAGSKVIYELHGHWREATCIRCYNIYPSDTHLLEFLKSGDIPHCDSCGGILKPNVILYGEQLPINILNEAQRLARTCDLMLVVGSSLEVTPASQLPMLALENDARIIIINLEPTYLDSYADITFHADVVDVLPALANYVDRL
ncbi:MAG: NAD-dependent protein deacylase Cob2 [Anaerolineae bacterium]|nr:MAG: NAD-dependent protein deacylase Cob2 [Anaerolineae bacterium]